MRDAALEIRNDAAEVMRDHLEVGEAVHDAGEHQARERGAGLERPADDAADFVFRFVLAAIVRHLTSADRMQQDRLAGFLDDLIDRQELLLVDRRAVDVGVKLDGVRAVLEARAQLRARPPRARSSAARPHSRRNDRDASPPARRDRRCRCAPTRACLAGPASRSSDGMPRQMTWL